MPGLLALGGGESPVKQIAQVREDLSGRTCFVSDVEAGEMVGCATQGFSAAVSDSGDGVAKQLPCGIGRWSHTVIPFS